MSDDLNSPENERPTITELSKQQRRVIGVLVEKGLTTPEYYPLTLKALTAGCNQKSNRYPAVHYSEDDVLDVLDELRELGLAAVVHTESGRTERFRHYMRKRFTFTEPQLAIVTELLLRGRQAMGELRARASRMVPIESLDDLRQELHGLMETGFVQSSGPLERRGVEIDHNFYAPSENKSIQADVHSEPTGGRLETQRQPAPSPTTQPVAHDSLEPINQRIAELQSVTQQLQFENKQLRDEFDTLKQDYQTLDDAFDRLRQDLGG